MADDADRAQAYEEREREQSILRARAKPEGEPLIIDGERVCLDCHEPMSAARLSLVPHALRCILCQTLMERKQHGTS